MALKIGDSANDLSVVVTDERVCHGFTFGALAR